MRNGVKINMYFIFDKPNEILISAHALLIFHFLSILMTWINWEMINLKTKLNSSHLIGTLPSESKSKTRFEIPLHLGLTFCYSRLKICPGEFFCADSIIRFQKLYPVANLNISSLQKFNGRKPYNIFSLSKINWKVN